MTTDLNKSHKKKQGKEEVVSLKTNKNKKQVKQESSASEEEFSEQEEEAFFQDSDDNMDWSEEDDDASEHSEDEEEEEEEDFDEEAFVDSEDGEDVDEDDEAVEFVDEDSEAEEAVEDSEDEALEAHEALDSEEEALDTTKLKERDLNVPSRVAPTSNPLLKHFWKLGDANKNARFEAVSDLIAHLQSSQECYTPMAVESTTESSDKAVLSLYDSGALKSTCCPDLTYTIKRLLKGLATGRDDARFGFMLALLAVYTAFTPLLAEHAETLFFWTMRLSSAETLGGSTKHRDEKLLMVCRLFGLSALLRSPQLLAQLSPASLKRCIDSLCSLAKKKSFLREPVVEVLISMLKGRPDCQLEAYTFRRLGQQSALMCETLALALALGEEACLKEEVEGDLPMPGFVSEFNLQNGFLAPVNTDPLMHILNELPCLEGGRLHVLWQYILPAIKADGLMTPAAFLHLVIEGMFLSSMGVLKRWIGFSLIKELISQQPRLWIPLAFGSPSTMRAIRSALGMIANKAPAQPPSADLLALNAWVGKYLRELIAGGVDGSVDALAIVTTLGRTTGVMQAIMGGNEAEAKATLNQLYDRLSLADVKALVAGVVISEDPSLSVGAYVGQFERLAGMCKIDRLMRMPGAEEWIDAVLRKLVKASFTATSDEERLEAIRNRLLALLNELQDSRLLAKKTDWMARASQMIKENLAGSLDEPTEDAMKGLDVISRAKVSQERLGRALNVFVAHFRLLCFVDPVDAIPVINEVAAVLKDKGNVVLVLVEVCLTFLSKASAFTRHMCEEIIRALVPLLNLATLEPFIKVLQAGRPEDLMAGDDEAEAEDDEWNSDVSEDDNEQEQEEENAELNRKLREVTELPDDSSSESDLDDDAMEAFDDKLAEIFRERGKIQKSAADARTRVRRERRDLLMIKGRVVDALAMAFRSGDLSLDCRMQLIPQLLACVARNQSLSKTALNANKDPANNSALKDGDDKAKEQLQFCSKLEGFFGEAYGRQVRPASAEEAKLASKLAGELMSEVDESNTVGWFVKLAEACWFLVKVVRSAQKSNAQLVAQEEATIKAAFCALVGKALGESVNEAGYRLLRGFVMEWAKTDLQYVLAALNEHSEALISVMTGTKVLRPFQRRQMLEFITSVVKRGSSFGPVAGEQLKNIVAKLPETFTAVYLPSLDASLTAQKVDYFREDLKLIQVLMKKSTELGLPVDDLKAVKAAMEAHFSAIQPPTAAIKSFLSQLRS